VCDMTKPTNYGFTSMESASWTPISGCRDLIAKRLPASKLEKGANSITMIYTESRSRTLKGLAQRPQVVYPVLSSELVSPLMILPIRKDFLMESD
jgi:hypothetical protein